MKALLTSRAEIDIFGKTFEKEDIIPVEFEKEEKNVSFRINKTEFIYKLIKKSEVFAINIPIHSFEKEADLCEINEGEFTDKFKLINTEKIECNSIDCPSLSKSLVLECSFSKEQQEKEGILISGKIINEKQTY